MNETNANSLLVAILIVACVALGAGLQFMAASGNSGQPAVTASTTTITQTANPAIPLDNSTPYVLNLVITTSNTFNSSVGDQPAYYVLGPGGSLQSSANISLPAHRLVEVVITNYDEGNDTPIQPQYANVTGTVNGTMSVVSDAAVNSTQGASGIVVGRTQTVSGLPDSVLSHTFTVPQMGLNLPVAAESTVIAYFRTGGPGTYSWTCMTPCGSDPGGLGGAMLAAGWMSGSLAVVG